MKPIFLILLLSTLITSCAHKKGIRNVDELSLDGLRSESLNRYSFNNLANVKNHKKSIAMCHKGDYNQATNNFKKSLDKNQNNPEYWNQLATCYLLNNKLSQSKFYYDLALKTSNKNKRIKTLIYNNLGVYYMKLNMYPEALASFKNANKVSKNFLTPKYNLAQIYLKFGLYKKASPLLKTLLAKESRDIDFINSFAHLNLMTGKYKLAKSLYSKIPKKYLSRDDIATNFAMTLYMLGEYKEALKVVSDAKSQMPYYELAQDRLVDQIENILK